MLGYYFVLGLRSLRRNPVLTALMILTLAVGVAASVSTLTILRLMSGDPIPHKSTRLLVPLLDNGPEEGYTPGSWFDPQLSYRDVRNLLASNQGQRRTAMYGIAVAIEPERSDLQPMKVEGLAPTSDFFAMFDTPFLFGQAWSAAQDVSAADVVVLSRGLSEKLFGKVDPTGRLLRLADQQFRIVGVIDYWQPQPRFYHMTGGWDAFGHGEELMMPFATALRHQVTRSGGMSCTGRRSPGWEGLLESECTWMQAWFEVKSAADRHDLQTYLDAYATEQRKLGRFPRSAANRLFDVVQWMDYLKVVGNDNVFSVYIAMGFLLLCMVNTTGLLMAKFSVRAGEVGVRRALGASRRQILTQFMIETSVIGLSGAVLGGVLAFGALALIVEQSKALPVVVHMDWHMLSLSLALSLGAALVAGLLPTLRACRIAPSVQLKSQ